MEKMDVFLSIAFAGLGLGVIILAWMFMSFIIVAIGFVPTSIIIFIILFTIFIKLFGE